jgi:hypothetical protein
VAVETSWAVPSSCSPLPSPVAGCLMGEKPWMHRCLWACRVSDGNELGGRTFLEVPSYRYLFAHKDVRSISRGGLRGRENSAIPTYSRVQFLSVFCGFALSQVVEVFLLRAISRMTVNMLVFTSSHPRLHLHIPEHPLHARHPRVRPRRRPRRAGATSYCFLFAIQRSHINARTTTNKIGKKVRLFQNRSRPRPQPVKEPGPRPDLAIVILLQQVGSRVCYSKPAARHYIWHRAAFAIN